MQEIELRLIVKPKIKSAVWNSFHIKSDSDGCLSKTNKPIKKCFTPVAASYGNISNLLIIYIVNILWFMFKFTIRRNLREPKRDHLLKVPLKVSINKPLNMHSV